MAVSLIDRWAARALLVITLLFLFSTDVSAADEKSTGPSEIIFLIQILALILVGRALGELMQRMGQPAVTGKLIAGILLGHSVFGVLWPDAQHWMFPSGHEQKAMLDGISQLGILMLLLLTGMETDLRLVRRVGRAAISVSGAGIIVPFACGFALGVERLLELMQPAQYAARLPDVYLVHQGESAGPFAFGVAEQLRDRSLTVVFDCGGGSFKSQMKKADASGARYAVIVGDDEVGAQQVSVKPLRNAGAQTRCAVAQAADLIKLKGAE